MKNAQKPRLDIMQMANVGIEHVNWLVYPYVPLGKITLLQGDPGTGKTFVALSLGASVTTGVPMPFGIPTDGELRASGKPGNVLYVTAEDGIGDTLKPRFKALGGDEDRFYATAGTVDVEGADGQAHFDLSQIDLLDDVMEDVHPKLLVIDPLQGFLGAGVDMHRANEIRPLMSKLGKLAAKHNCACLVVGHLNKTTQSPALYRALGSIDIIAAARSALYTGTDPNSDDFALVQTKCSVGPKGPAQGYEIDDSGLHWKGTIDVSAQSMLQPVAGPRSLEAAKEFLREMLRDGPRLSSDLYRLAEELGIADRTLDRARDHLRIVCRPTGFQKPWEWRLPVEEPIASSMADCGSLELKTDQVKESSSDEQERTIAL